MVEFARINSTLLLATAASILTIAAIVAIRLERVTGLFLTLVRLEENADLSFLLIDLDLADSGGPAVLRDWRR